MRRKNIQLILTFGMLALSTPAFCGNLDELALKLSSEIKGQNSGKIAVLEFSGLSGGKSQTPGIVQERLTTAMAQDKSLDIVERNLLRRVLEEQKLQLSGVITETDVKAIGKITGADAVVTGTISDLDNNEIEINARVIHVESGKILAAGIARIKREWAVTLAGSISSTTFDTPAEFADELTQGIKPAITITANDIAVFEKIDGSVLGPLKNNFRNSQKLKESIAEIDNLLKTKSAADSFLRYTRAMLNLQAKEYSEAIKDANAFIIMPGSDGVETLPKASGYSLRAKAYKALGNYKSAISDLSKAIELSPTKPSDVIQNSGVKPSPEDIWTKEDFDEFIRKNPKDYQGYIFRGVYYNSYAVYDWTYKELSTADLRKAVALAPSVPIAHYLLAKNLSDAKESIRELTKAIQSGPKLSVAYADRAQAYYDAKKYDLAIKDYNTLLELDPKNAGAYNDRGLSKYYRGDYYGAVWDFNDAIRLKTHGLTAQASGADLSLANTYENRAKANIALANYQAVISDLTLSIHYHLKSASLLINSSKFRRLYPEYKEFTDEMLAEMLWKKFSPLGPNGKYSDYFERFISKQNSYFSNTILELYVMRGDAYLNNGDFKNAIKEYNRAASDSNYAGIVWNDRWKQFSVQNGEQMYIDVKTIDFARPTMPTFWVKSTKSDLTSIAYNYRVNCAAKQIMALGIIVYDSEGSVKNQINGGEWEIVAPQSLGEKMYLGACR